MPIPAGAASRIFYRGTEITEGTFEDNGVSDDAQVSVVVNVDAVGTAADRLHAMNPHLSREEMTEGTDRCRRKRLEMEEDGVTVKNWYLTGLGLVDLPDELFDVPISGDLSLDNNEIRSLPAAVGRLKVGGDLLLECNGLTTLPSEMAQMEVGGTLYLYGNPGLDEDAARALLRDAPFRVYY